MIAGYPLETYEQRIRRKLDDLICRVFGAPFGRPIAPPFGPRVSTASVAWYELLTNGLAAFQPIGAASYAASKVNLLDPGTNDAADGAAYPTWDASYGWALAAASLQYLTVGSGALVTEVPLTIAVLFQANDVTTTYALGTIRRTSTSNDGWMLNVAGSIAGDPVRGVSVQNGLPLAQVDTTSGYSASTWHTAIAVFASSTSRSVYLDGANKGTNTTSNTPSTSVDATMIGVNHNGTVYGAYLDGKVGAIGFAGATHSDAEALAIHNSLIALVL